MNRFGSDVVAWVGILGGGAVTVAVTAALMGLRAGGPAPTASIASSACAPTAEANRELRVSTVEPPSGVEGRTVKYVFRTPCSTSDDEKAERRIHIRVSSKSGGTHVQHVPLITRIERAEVDAPRIRFERERSDAMRELREELREAERRLREATERLAEAREEAEVGDETRERMELLRAEMAELVGELVRELAEAEESG